MAQIQKITFQGPVAQTSMVEVKVGDWVGFKSDVEQYGQVTKIAGDWLHLRNSQGFRGAYLNGDKTAEMHIDDCWLDC